MSRTLRISALLGLVAAGAVALLAGLPAQQPQPSRVMRMVASALENGHVSRHPLDDTISERALEAYLEALDPMKLYFYRADVDTLARSRDQIDDMLEAGDPRFAYAAFDRFRDRAEARVAMVEELLAGPFDFTADEAVVTDPKLLDYPRDEAEARERWRKRIKLDLLALRADGLADQEARERLSRRYHTFERRTEGITRDDVLAMFLTAVTTSYDPHSTYLSPAVLADFDIAMSLNYQGIGARLSEEDGYAVVKSIMPGGAAAKQGGLDPDDRIVTVGQGDDGPLQDVVGMRLDDVVKQIRGPAGTVVRLGVVPKAGGANRVCRLVRARTELQDSAAHGEVFDVEQGAGEGSSALKVGVIDLPGFYHDTESERAGRADFRSSTEDLRRLLAGFAEQGVQAVVLDLRRNGGGLLSEAVGVTGLFIDRGPVVLVKGAGGRVVQHDDLESGVAWSGPLVVLTSRLSASASEIVAGAIQDYRRGLVVGDESTHGKGTVQTILELGEHGRRRSADDRSLGAVKLTIQQFYRPGGSSTQRRGVPSDIVLPSMTNEMDLGEAELPHALEFDRIPSAAHQSYELVDAHVTRMLAEASKARRAQSAEFARLQDELALYGRLRARKSISVNEERYLAVKAELDAAKPVEDELEQPASGAHGVKRDGYFDEVLDITADYVHLLRGGRVATSR